MASVAGSKGGLNKDLQSKLVALRRFANVEREDHLEQRYSFTRVNPDLVFPIRFVTYHCYFNSNQKKRSVQEVITVEFNEAYQDVRDGGGSISRALGEEGDVTIHSAKCAGREFSPYEVMKDFIELDQRQRETVFSALSPEAYCFLRQMEQIAKKGR